MRFIFVFSFVIPALGGCYYDNQAELHPSTYCDTSGTVSFANDILPIMNTSCGAQRSDCHQNNATASGYGLANYTDVDFTVVDNGDVFLKSITHDPSIPSKWMPKGVSSKIDDCSIQKIEAWLNQGRPNN